MHFLRNLSTTPLALLCFLGSAISTVALTSCEQGKMGCLVSNSSFAAVFTKVSGADCMPPVGELYFEYYLGIDESVDPPVPDPTTSSLAVVVPRARDARDLADTHVAKLQKYEKCPDRDMAINTKPNLEYQKQPFYAYSKFKKGGPDAEELCYANKFAPASISTPAMTAIPACMGFSGDMPTPELPAKAVQYQVRDVVVQVSPAVQGLHAKGKIDFTGGDCVASYTFNAIAPVVKCSKDAQCNDVKDDKNRKTAAKVNEAFRDKGVKCHIEPGKSEGMCVLKK